MSAPQMLLVPRQPSEAMIRAGDQARRSALLPTAEIWAAMLYAHELASPTLNRPRRGAAERALQIALRALDGIAEQKTDDPFGVAGRAAADIRALLPDAGGEP